MKGRRILKSITSTVLMVLVFAAFGLILQTTLVEAKAAPKLSAKSVTLAYGGKHTIKLQNGKGKWTVQGDDVVKVTKITKTQITLAPVKAGTASVICKSGKKKLKCRVVVLNNNIGAPETDLGNAAVVGQAFTSEYTLPKGVSLESVEYDKAVGKITVKTKLDPDTGETDFSLKFKALKAGRFPVTINYMNEDEPESEEFSLTFINGFRGKTKVKKTEANYKKWRKKIISSMVSSDMSTWEIIDAIGQLISSGRYGMKGGATGLQLWYGGNGTCVSGAKMMNDFMKDLGVTCKVHFAGDDDIAEDIFGFNVGYGFQHKNVRVKLGGKRYELNPQPGMVWPYGTVKR